MEIHNAFIVLFGAPIKMDASELAGFTGNTIWDASLLSEEVRSAILALRAQSAPVKLSEDPTP